MGTFIACNAETDDSVSFIEVNGSIRKKNQSLRNIKKDIELSGKECMYHTKVKKENFCKQNEMEIDERMTKVSLILKGKEKSGQTCEDSFQLEVKPLTMEPTISPTHNPMSSPSSTPSSTQSTLPTSYPSLRSSVVPSNTPVLSPTSVPSTFPSIEHSLLPSSLPSSKPSSIPTLILTTFPSINPTLIHSRLPSNFPSSNPSFDPSRSPSYKPSLELSFYPTIQHSLHPTTYYSKYPTEVPTRLPSCTIKADVTCIEKETGLRCNDFVINRDICKDIVFKYTFIACNAETDDSVSFIEVNGSIRKKNQSLRNIKKDIELSGKECMYHTKVKKENFCKQNEMKIDERMTKVSLILKGKEKSGQTCEDSFQLEVKPLTMEPTISPTHNPMSSPSSTPSSTQSTLPTSYPSLRSSVVPSNTPVLSPTSVPSTFP